MAENCVDIVSRATGGNREEAQEALSQIAAERDRLVPMVESAKLAGALRDYARKAGDDAELAARIAKREKLDNILKAAEFEARVRSDMDLNGVSYEKSLAELLHKVADAQKGTVGVFMSPYIEAFKADPVLHKLLKRSADFQEEVIRARHLLAAGETPPAGHDQRAWDFARLVNENEERMRVALNDQGAQIGKLEGYGGRHKHNSTSIAKDLAGHDRMLRDTLDFDQSFPWLGDLLPAEREAAIADIILNIQSHILKGKDAGERINPNDYTRGRKKRWRTTSGMEHSRELVFKDVEAWIQYNRRFGEDSVLGSVYETAQRSAEKLALLRHLGTRPEATITSLVDKRVRELRASKAGLDKATLKEVGSLSRTDLDDGSGLIGRTWKVVSGQDRAPVNITMASIAGGVRQVVSMTKLGGAVLSSFSDVPIGAMHFKTKYGYSLIEAWGQNLRGWFSRIPPELRQEFAGLADVFCDGFKGHLGARLDGDLNINGALSRATERFFTFSGLTGWTDNGKAGAVRMLSAVLGDRAKLKFSELRPEMQHTLRNYGLDQHWDLIREHMTFEHVQDGKSTTYIVPERAKRIPDSVIDDLITERIAAVKKDAAGRGYDPVPAIDKLRRDARNRIDMDLHTFFAAEVDDIILTPDTRTRAIQTFGGLRPGTVGGEVARTVMQFKSFPIAFWQKVLKPMVLGRPGQEMSGRIANTALMMAQMTAFGYLSMEVKRLARGEKPYFMSEDPDWTKAAMGAFLQGGGAGIYGDFLFAEASRFGGGFVESLAGPTLGMVGDIDRLRGLAMSTTEELKGADVLNTVVNNTPYINLWYTRALLDYSFLYSAREALSPGWMKRRERNMRRNGGREYLFPPAQHALRPFD